MAWLNDHPPKRSQFRHPRRDDPSGVIVVHTAENAPDTQGGDGGAEAVANFIRNRTDPGSYHDLVDSDTVIQLVEYGDEAFHDGTGSNPHSLSISFATRAATWPSLPAAWVEGAIELGAQRAAVQARWVKDQTGIVVPARRISRDESERKVPGFISHALRDPTRRSDPGSTFPWDQFLARYAALTDPQEDDMSHPYAVVRVDGGPDDGDFFLVGGGTRRHLPTPDLVKAHEVAWGPARGIPAAAWADLAADTPRGGALTALDMRGVRSLIPEQGTELSEIHAAVVEGSS